MTCRRARIAKYLVFRRKHNDKRADSMPEALTTSSGSSRRPSANSEVQFRCPAHEWRLSERCAKSLTEQRYAAAIARHKWINAQSPPPPPSTRIDRKLISATAETVPPCSIFATDPNRTRRGKFRTVYSS